MGLEEDMSVGGRGAGAVLSSVAEEELEEEAASPAIERSSVVAPLVDNRE